MTFIAPSSHPSPTAVILLAHGSADPRSPGAVEATAVRLGQRTGITVVAAYLEHVGPDLRDAVAGLAARRVSKVAVLPLLLGAAYHANVDVPVALAAAANLGCIVEGLDPIGHPTQVLEAVLAGSGPTVLAAAGTSVESERHAFAAAVMEAARSTDVPATAAFASGAGTTIAEAVAELRGHGPVGVVPWLLAPGAFTDRVSVAAQAAGATYRSVPGGLLAHPAMLSELERRIRTATAPA